MGKKTVQNDTEDDLLMAFKVFDKVRAFDIPICPHECPRTVRASSPRPSSGSSWATSETASTTRHARNRIYELPYSRFSQETESLVNQADPGGGGTINYAQFVRSMWQAIQGR